MSASKLSEKDDSDVVSLPESAETEKNMSFDSLPEKSREKYRTSYQRFMEWKKLKDDKPIVEEILLDYFLELSIHKKPSTLWATYSMLKQTIKMNENINIGEYKELKRFLKKKSVGFESKKTKCLRPSDIEKFLNEAPNRKYLAVKVALIFGIIGACKREELCSITTKDIEDDGTFALINIRNTMTNRERSFTIVGEFYKIFKKYADLRPANPTTDRFFMKYVDGKCVHQVIGINKFGSMPKLVAHWLKLPEADSYTGHSFRLTSATLFAESGADVTALRSDVGLQSKFAKCYRRETIKRKKRLCQEMMKSVNLKASTADNDDDDDDYDDDDEPNDPLSPSIPSTSVAGSNQDFEAVYLPLKQEEENTPGTFDNPIDEKSESESHLTLIMQSTTTSNQSAKSMKVTNPSVLRTQVRNIAPAPSQQQTSPKTLVLKTIPLKVKQVASTTIKIPPKAPTVRVPQNVLPQQPAEVCLRWNSYHSNMQNSFPSLLDSEEFVDVTLACEGKSVKCHKIILSSCSDYLAQLLRENPCPHPIILMKDLKFWEVEALVKFMYRGEVNVAHDKLPQLLNAAEALQVKGLAGPIPSQVQKPPMLIPHSKPQSSTPPVSQKSSEPKEHKSQQGNSSSSSQSSPKRGTKRPGDTEKSRPPPKIRPQRSKSPTRKRSDSPQIKLEPLDLPLSPADIFPDNNDDNSITNYDNLMTMHDDDDPGGEERPDSTDCDIQFELHDDDDNDNDNDNDGNEQMEFVPTDFLEQEQDIIDEADRESTRSSIIEIRRGDTRHDGHDENSRNEENEKTSKKDKT